MTEPPPIHYLTTVTTRRGDLARLKFYSFAALFFCFFLDPLFSNFNILPFSLTVKLVLYLVRTLGEGSFLLEILFYSEHTCSFDLFIKEI